MGETPRAPAASEIAEALSLAARSAAAYLDALPDEPVLRSGAEEAFAPLDAPLPEHGDGAIAAVAALLEHGLPAATRSAGPRFFHFVTGGTTPAALAADWLTSALDQNALGFAASPLAARLEAVSLAWLKELFGLPASFGGVLTTGATAGNLVGLAAARRWWGQRHGVDVEEAGLAALPPVPVLTSGYVHSSALKALAMLGIGRGAVRVLARDDVGRLDPAALEAGLRELGGAPAIVIGTAGEVNAGDFDPLPVLGDLAEEYGAWLHVDGAFGLFARLSPETAHLADGVERAHSVSGDGHKWLNVPYESGFAFVHDPALLVGAFRADAAYLTSPDDPQPAFMHLGPELSRRARCLPVWATLAAYGRSGYRAVVERHLALAKRLAGLVDTAPDLERLADVPLNVVCFRFRPPGAPERRLDDLNRRLGDAVLADGRVSVGTTVYGGRVAFRPAIANWRTREEDVDLLVAVVRELGGRL